MKDHQENQDIESKLSLLQEVPERNADQAAAGLAKFLARAEALRAADARTPVPGSRRQRVPAARKRWMPALAGILTALLLALGSVGGTVYASQVSLEIVVWGVIRLARTLANPSLALDAIELAGALALLVVGVPIFWFHWRMAQRQAGQEEEERFSLVRALFLYSALLVTFIPLVQNSHLYL